MFSKLFRKKEKIASQRPVPTHIAIVMDGNGRWAKKRGLPRQAGHKVGAVIYRYNQAVLPYQSLHSYGR